MRLLMVVLALTGPAVAQAEPLRILNGSPVRISVEGAQRAAVGVRQANERWRLQLDGDTAERRVEIVDVTAGAKGTKWVLPARRALELDAERFVADHAYRIRIVHFRAVETEAYVYLYPPADRKVTRLKLKEEPAAAEGELSVLPKGSL